MASRSGRDLDGSAFANTHGTTAVKVWRRGGAAKTGLGVAGEAVRAAGVARAVDGAYRVSTLGGGDLRDVPAPRVETFAGHEASGGAAASLEGQTTRCTYWRRCVHRINV